MTNTSRPKHEILEDLRRAEDAANQLPRLAEEAAQLDRAKEELAKWEEPWHRREVAARNEAERISRDLQDAQAALLPVLNEMLDSPLGRTIGALYKIARLREELATAVSSFVSTAYQRALAEAAERKGATLDMREVSTVAASYGATATETLQRELCADTSLLGKVPAGKSRILGQLIANFAFPPRRESDPLDTQNRK